MATESSIAPSRLGWKKACHLTILTLTAALVVGFYAWAVSPGRPLFGQFDGGGSYYNLLVKGFRAGHLNLQVETPPGLLKLKDPYDPKQNAPFGMHDVSYYKGKFYLYFGVAPALVAYWPFAALTGRYLDDSQVVFLLCTCGFLAASVLLLGVRRRYFPAFGLGADLVALLAMGMTTMVPVLLRRQQVYEVAVSSAHAFFMLSLLALYFALHGKRRSLWLAAASLAYGLAIASRPTYVFGSVVLLIPVIAHSFAGAESRNGTGDGRFRRLLAAAVPIGLVLAGLLVYNDLRFESPFEFGQRLALSGSDETQITHFSLSYFWFNCHAYLFAPAQISAYFPFVRVVSLPPAPPGHYGIEDPYGIFPNIPFVILAALAPLACVRRPRLGWFVAAVALAAASVAAVIFLFQFATNRYMVDFLPGFILLAVLGFWGLLESTQGAARKTACLLGCAALVGSVLFNLFAAFNHNELLRVNDPVVFRKLLHAFDMPRFIVDKIVGKHYGPLEITLKFPTDKVGMLEPIVVSGSEFLSDYLYVYYMPGNKIALGFEHAGYGGPVSDPLPIDFSKPHTFTVDMPPLYPPLGDPYFDGIPERTVEAFNARLKVSLDGTEIFDTPQQFYPAFGSKPMVGRGAPSQAALGRRFTGEIMEGYVLARDWKAVEKDNDFGPVAIMLEFPSNNAGAHEPLLTSGSPGHGDVLVVNYVDSNHVTFTVDHWGYGGPTSAPVEIKPGTRQTLEVSFGSFFPASQRPASILPSHWAAVEGKVLVRLDKVLVFDAKTPTYDAPAETIAIGRNTIGASSSVAQFSGRIVSSCRGGFR